MCPTRKGLHYLRSMRITTDWEHLLVLPNADSGAFINPHTVVKKLHPNPVLRGPHGPRGLFQVKRHFTSWQRASLRLNIGCSPKK